MLFRSNVVVSPLVEVEELGTKKWELCLVGRFLDTKLPPAVVSSITRKLWLKQGLMDVIPHGKGLYIFRFSQPSGAKDVLEGGPWLIAGRHLCLRWWSPKISWQREDVLTVPIWVQLHNVPLEFWTAEGLSYLANAVGKPLYADAVTESSRRLQYARVCVVVDAMKPLITEFTL